MTEWKQCPIFPAYELTRDGRIRRRKIVRGKPPQELKPWIDNGYPRVSLMNNGKIVKVYVHRLIGITFLGLSRKQEIDHRYHNRTDIWDIRVATRAQNTYNTRGKKNSTSSYKGVSLIADRGLWYACIKLDGKTRALGKFKTERDAALAYDRAAKRAWGDFAYLNLPDHNI